MSSAPTARSIAWCRDSAAEGTREPGTSAQWPKERKPSFFSSPRMGSRWLMRMDSSSCGVLLGLVLMVFSLASCARVRVVPGWWFKSKPRYFTCQVFCFGVLHTKHRSPFAARSPPPTPKRAQKSPAARTHRTTGPFYSTAKTATKTTETNCLRNASPAEPTAPYGNQPPAYRRDRTPQGHPPGDTADSSRRTPPQSSQSQPE